MDIEFELDLDLLKFFGAPPFPCDHSALIFLILTLTLFVLAVLLVAVRCCTLLFACWQNEYRARSFDHFL